MHGEEKSSIVINVLAVVITGWWETMNDLIPLVLSFIFQFFHKKLVVTIFLYEKADFWLKEC